MQALVPSSIVVPAPAAVMSPSFDGADSLAPISSYGPRVHEDIVPPAESLEPAPWMDKGKQPVEEGFQRKRKRAVSVASDKSATREGLMADASVLVTKMNFLELTHMLIRGVGLRMSRTVVDNSLFIFFFLSNG